MAMTVTEANAVNVVVSWLLPNLCVGLVREPTEAEAIVALEVLVTSAYKRLMAGVMPDQVSEGWPAGRFADIARRLEQQARDHETARGLLRERAERAERELALRGGPQ